MANIRIPENELPIRDLTTGDYVRVVSEAGMSYRVPKHNFAGSSDVSELDGKIDDTKTELEEEIDAINGIYYGLSTTSGSAQTKVVTSPDFVLAAGKYIVVSFSQKNTYSGTVKLNINDTGEYSVQRGVSGFSYATPYVPIMYLFRVETQGGSYVYRLVGPAYKEATTTEPGYMSTADKAKLDGIEPQANKTVVDDALSTTSTNPVQNKVITGEIDDLKAGLSDLTERVDAIEDTEGLARYGVSGIGQSASALTRTYDAVGMTAQVGTDGDNSNVINNFDNAAPWMWRKCVGHWTAGNGHAIFHVHAYMGDEDYTEDGTNGDYVAVECPRSYYKFDGSNLVISAHQYDGFRPFDIFCRDHDPEDTIAHYYRPAYSLTLKDGKAVSLPGYDNEQGAYKTLMDAARTYDGGAMGTLPILYPMALSFYDWAMFTVEFATQNCQAIMQGCAGLRHNADDRLTFRDSTHVLVGNWYTSRVAGEYIAIVPTNVDINVVAVQATHKITAVTRCTADGTPSSSGTYTLLELEDLGRAYYTYDLTGATEYRICGRPYRTGSCNGVSTPSGSPVSNTDSFHPMKYRWVENLFGNQYKTVADFFNKRVGTGDDDWILEHYYLLKPWEYTPSSTSKPDATDLATDKFVKLDVETAHANYVSGYVKSKKYSSDYPEIWIPFETTGGSASTYACDYAYLVNSPAVRSVRLYGYWNGGAYDGLSFFFGLYAPSTASGIYGGDLCFPQ